jgi:hypothetical protein
MKGDKRLINTSLGIPSEVDLSGSGAEVNNRVFLPAPAADTDIASADRLSCEKLISEVVQRNLFRQGLQIRWAFLYLGV